MKKRSAKDVGIASNIGHLKRSEGIVEQAKKECIVDKDFTIHRLETPETLGQWFYELITRPFYRYKLSRGLEYAKKTETPGWINKIKNYVVRLLPIKIK